MRGDLVRKLLFRGLTASLAVLAFFALALLDLPWWGLALTCATGVSACYERRIRPAADLVAECTLLTAGGLVAGARHLPGGVDWALVLTGAALLGMLLLERPLRHADSLRIRTANLDVPPAPTSHVTHLAPIVLALLVGLATTAALATPVWPVMAVTLLAAAGCVAAARSVLLRRLRPGTERSPVAQALERHRPEFVLYFAAPPGSQYQVLMWLPYLERIGRPFMVILREAEHLAPVSAATSAPVLVCPTLPTVGEAIVPNLRVAFYVNHGAKNAHCVRFRQLTHIQLHHGDSDKAPSATPVSAMFDKIFVAGQAAIDRYARNNVVIPRDKFVIVGRPQVESIAVRRSAIRDLTDKVVLYTPTWTGHFSDVNYSSLPVGAELLQRLLARGTTVILRAHPYTARNATSARLAGRMAELLAADQARTGRKHVWGAAATRMSLVDSVNASDALVSDVSGVISDYLYSGKPYAVTDMVNEGNRFTTEFPLARAGYVVRSDLSNLDRVLDELLDSDPLAETRWAVRTEYLGDFPTESYAEEFLRQARRHLDPTAPVPPAQRSGSEAATLADPAPLPG